MVTTLGSVEWMLAGSDVSAAPRVRSGQDAQRGPILERIVRGRDQLQRGAGLRQE